MEIDSQCKSRAGANGKKSFLRIPYHLLQIYEKGKGYAHFCTLILLEL
jgi:hypothetical protein